MNRADKIYKLNRMNAIGRLTQLGSLIEGPYSSTIGIKVPATATLTTGIDLSDNTIADGQDIVLSNGVSFGSGSIVPTHAAALGSLYIRTGQADEKAVLYICTVITGTWVLLTTVTA